MDPTGLVIAIMVLLALVAGLLAFRLFKPAVGQGDEPDERSKLLGGGGAGGISHLGSGSDEEGYGATSSSNAMGVVGYSAGIGSYSLSAAGGSTHSYNGSVAAYATSGRTASPQTGSGKQQGGTVYNEGTDLDNLNGGDSSMAQYIRVRNTTAGIF